LNSKLFQDLYEPCKEVQCAKRQVYTDQRRVLWDRTSQSWREKDPLHATKPLSTNSRHCRRHKHTHRTNSASGTVAQNSTRINSGSHMSGVYC